MLFATVDGQTTTPRIALALTDTGEWRVLLDNGDSAQYVSAGYIVFVRPSGSIWAVQFDVEALALTGDSFLVDEVSIGSRGDVSGANLALAESGTLLFQRAPEPAQSRLAWVGTDGARTTLLFEEQVYKHPRLSPDSRRVAVTIDDLVNGRQDIWILDLARGTQTRLTFEGQRNRWPVWTHDGSRIAFVSTRAGSPFDLYSMPSDGSAAARPLLRSERGLIAISWAQVHEALAYYGMDRFADIRTLLPDGSTSEFLATAFDERSPLFSTDGDWLIYVSDESGQDEIYLRPYPGPGARVQISNEGGVEPGWSADGSSIYYRKGDSMMVVGLDRGARRPLPPELLFSGPYLYGELGRGNPNYDVAADGRFLMLEAVSSGTSSRLVVVLNWLEELKARASAGQ